MGGAWERERGSVAGKGEGSEEVKKDRKEKRKGGVRTEGKQLHNQAKRRRSFGQVSKTVLHLRIREKVNDQAEYSFIHSTNTVSNINLVGH